MSSSPPVAYLTRREAFSAAHRLWSDRLSADENEALFGPCAGVHGHGHNYVIEVTVCGEIDHATGVVVNLAVIRDAVRGLIVSKVDHRHLNLDPNPCSGVNPTTENLAVVFWGLLHERFGNLLHEVRVHETDNNSAAYRGPRLPVLGGQPRDLSGGV